MPALLSGAHLVQYIGVNGIMKEETAIREELYETYLRMDREGLIFLSAGNVSARFEDGMLISPTRASAETITPAAFVATDFDGVAATGQPSSEWSMHAAIYKNYPQAQAVVHTHSDHCVALACLREDLPAFHYMIASFGGDNVRCTPYVIWASQQLADVAVEALAERTACLLGNHGMISHGKTLAKAFDAALRLEILTKQYLMARQAGTVRLLNESEMTAAIKRFANYG
jgi:L-fuculose-phosphate aldolase